MVYIDDAYKQYKGYTMCHLVADTEEELHNFALTIGLKREWYQCKPNKIPHYDVSLLKRALAVQRGAKEITQKQLIKIAKKYCKSVEVVSMKLISAQRMQRVGRTHVIHN